MNVEKKILGRTAILLLVLIAVLFVFQETNENQQSAFEYSVQTRDTCGNIAVAFNVSVISIVEANNLKRDCSNIYEGQILFIPYPTSTPLGSPTETVQYIVIDCVREKYTVKAGDTLEVIANKYEVPIESIIFFNGLTQDKLEAGTQLVIPLCYPTPDP